MSAPELRKGWCPGALRPMPSGDGLLVRLRLTAGELSGARARALAMLAAEYGSGAIDLSHRANLQLRGVRDSSLPELLSALGELGVLDANAAAEAVRNVMVSPLAGVDASCADGRELARALEARLRQDEDLQRLPGKFGFAVDGGGRWPLGLGAADIGLRTAGAGAPWQVQLAGSGVLSAPLPAGQEVAGLAKLARSFLDTGLRRMSAFVARNGAASVLAAAGRPVGAALPPAAAVAPAPGLLLLPGASVAAVIGLPFGRIEAGQLSALAAATGDAALWRLTPWRLIVIPMPDTSVAEDLLSRAAALGFIAAPGDAQLRIAACTGAPSCPNGTTPVREDAAMLARTVALPTEGIVLHLSGCPKGCAHQGCAAVTLVARAGRYDLITQGTVDDVPIRTGLARDSLAREVADALNSLGAAS